mgnify:CR=1 FL=1
MSKEHTIETLAETLCTLWGEDPYQLALDYAYLLTEGGKTELITKYGKAFKRELHAAVADHQAIMNL